MMMDLETSRRHRDRLIVGMAVLCLLSLAITVVVSYTTLSNRSDLLSQKQGRAAALNVSCGANAARSSRRAGVRSPARVSRRRRSRSGRCAGWASRR